jgi:hypothetical protein
VTDLLQRIRRGSAQSSMVSITVQERLWRQDC